MISLLTITSLLTSLVSADPVPRNIAITRRLGPDKTTFRHLQEYQEEEQNRYFVPVKRYEESDPNQTVDISPSMRYEEADANQIMDLSFEMMDYTSTEPSVSSNNQEFSPTETERVSSMMGQVMRMARNVMPRMMSTDVLFEKVTIVAITAVAIYVAIKIICAIIERIFGIQVSIPTTMRRAATAIVNTASGLLGDSDSDNPRSERALNEITSMVYQAIDAFHKEYENRREK